MITVSVLMGGPSKESEVSIKSGMAISEALEAEGFKVYRIVFDQPYLPNIPEDTDVVFPALHGIFGEDGQIQELLETKGIPFVGCDSDASAIIIDKQKTKDVLNNNNIPCPQGMLVSDPNTPFPDNFTLPIVVKPNKEGSTIGLSIVESPDQWQEAISKGLLFDENIVVEEFIDGIELTVGLLNGKALPPVEIVPPGGLFDFDAKYEQKNGKTEYYCPPKTLTARQQEIAQAQAEKIYSLVGATDLLRVDMIAVDETLYVLEGNSLPGFTATSLYPKSAKAAGITFTELCKKLIENKLEVRV